MFWKTYFLATICVTACYGARSTPRSTTASTTPPTLPTVVMPPSQAPLTTQLPPQATPCPDDTLPSSPLQRLRSAMRDNIYTQMNAFFDAFLIFYSDEHLSEEPSAEERRLEYFSGWDGPGTAAVLASGGAAVWVPSGEVRRARATLSCSWLVLDGDDPGQPSVAEWIAGKLSRNGRVGADARLASLTEWQLLANGLQREGLQLIHVPTLLDQLWNEEQDLKRRRPEFSRIVANLHHSEYTGISWRFKVETVRNELRQIGADAMVVTALDEVAWLLNVRGRDVPYAPLLKAFVIISIRDLRVYAPPGKLSMPVREALAVYNCFTNTNNCTRVSDYTSIYADLRRASESKILIPTGGTFQRGASAAIAQSVAQAKRLYQLSPIIYLKAQKNAAEAKGMRVAHLRDAVAMSTLLSYMEGMVKTGLNEVSVAMKVDVTRATQANYVGHSMRTRVAFGPSGADADYRASVHSSRSVYRNSTLIIQSGGQYVEGTTMVTRTLHYGTPAREERRAYTTALRALAALSALQLPGALPAAHADLAVRAPLWAARQDYVHPTGHGVGAALNRREDPVVIDYRQDVNLHTLKEGYFITSEPAWYEPEKFGVRLGNVLEVVSKNYGYLNFAEATLVPFEPRLIEKSMLTEYEINWLNAYNQRIRNTVGPELKDQGLTDVYYWMMNKTVPLELPSQRVVRRSNSANDLKVATLLPLMLTAALTLGIL
ncbi:xaa-Pro aminopeptidase 1-like isoform X1 [Choristoneura fumiferana]|uniref:xaa-Pro aminopeptidase 1-like isoform X1 n=1 Tax=Choristoneura fumiferana TaxID=7141 RepID=UPI003D156380